jgi:hypothetical protein
MLAPIAALALFALSDVSAVADPKVAIPPHHFGEGGQMVTSAGLGINGSLIVPLAGGYTSYSVQLQPALDWFVISHLSVGGAVAFDVSGSKTPSRTSSSLDIGLSPRVGYLFPLGNSFSFWPRLLLFVGWRYARSTDSSHDAVTGGFGAGDGLVLPFEYELAPHVIVGLGLVLSSFTGLNLGLTSSVSGYF